MARRLFLERRTYRQNRLQDAARLLPVLGMVLSFAPVFIRGEATLLGGADLSNWLVYYFVIWIGLIVLTAFVSWSLTRTERKDTAETAPPPAEQP
ncbi:hypothetical protein [Roseicyclus sp.]|uniref:hypothetical protein n=1 Tax=Roseicyclus sp. TaxID=1914329 RepID=UPI003F6D6D3A